MTTPGLRWELIADTYRRLFHNAFFREMPATIYRVVGSAGFVDVVEIAARAVKDSFPDLVRECCLARGEELSADLFGRIEAYVQCHNHVASQLPGMARLSIMEADGDRLVLRVSDPASVKYSSKLLNAARAGVVVGILRALGAEAHAVASANHERLLHCKSDAPCFAVYVEDVDGKEYRVVIERR